MSNLPGFGKMLNTNILKLLLIFLTPSFVFAYFQHSSLFLGLVVSFFIYLFFLKKLHVKAPLPFLTVFSILILYSFIAINNNGDALKVFPSVFFIATMVFLLIGYLKTLDAPINEGFIFSIKFIYFLFLFLGGIAIFIKFPFGGYSFRHGSVFPFAEYSHFAIAYAFFALLYQLACKNNVGIIYCMPTFILGVAFPNLTTIIVGILQLVMIRSRYKVTLSLLAVCIFVPIIYFFMQDYVVSRLVFNEENKNLSNLVYLQGAETAYTSFLSTYGVGVGFQNMGIQEPGYFTELIRSVNNGDDLNRLDGSFLAAKIITEFGLLGLFLCIAVIINFLKVCKIVWSGYYPNGLLFVLYAASSGQIMIEFFVRGYGYFSPGFIMFLALFSLRSRILP